MPSENFLTWLFTEGDGSFIITEDLQFVITQKEISVVDMVIFDSKNLRFKESSIRDTLGFGQVIAQGQRTHRYICKIKKH